MIDHNCSQNEYASKAQGNTAVTLASVLGGIGTLGTLQNGGLGGILGGGNTAKELAAKDAEIATLRAEKYSDLAAKEEANRLLQNYLKPYGDEIAAAKVREARMQAEIDCIKETGKLREEIIRKDILLAKQEAACCCAQNTNAIAAISATLGKITQVGVPNTVLVPGVPPVYLTHTAPTTTTAAAA
jgi:hypothetical protein